MATSLKGNPIYFAKTKQIQLKLIICTFKMVTLYIGKGLHMVYPKGKRKISHSKVSSGRDDVSSQQSKPFVNSYSLFSGHVVSRNTRTTSFSHQKKFAIWAPGSTQSHILPVPSNIKFQIACHIIFFSYNHADMYNSMDAPGTLIHYLYIYMFEQVSANENV